MTDCEWNPCDNPADYTVVFMSPHERVNYCDKCIETVKLRFDYQSVDEI